MATNLSATEVVDFISDNFSNSKSDREGVQEIYIYRGGTTVDATELNSLTKAVILLPVEETTSFQLEQAV